MQRIWDDIAEHMAALAEYLALMRTIDGIPKDADGKVLRTPEWLAFARFPNRHFMVLANLEIVLGEISSKSYGPECAQHFGEWLVWHEPAPEGVIHGAVLDFARRKGIVSPQDADRLAERRIWQRGPATLDDTIRELAEEIAFLERLIADLRRQWEELPAKEPA